MWPRGLPEYISTEPLRAAECKVYRRLQSVLEDPFVVFYSRPWLGLTRFGEEIDGECDFLVAHPDMGILALEVKGGEIAYDPGAELWTSRDRWGITHRIKNPVNQALSSKHQILKKLQVLSVWGSRRIRARHGVIFPDSERPSEDLGAYMPLSIFCFLDEFEEDLRGWILDRLGEPDGFSAREQPLGSDGIRALEELLAHPFKLHVPLGNVLADDDTRIQTLSHQQFHIMSAIQDIPRAAISGGAGTGKTLLAMEEAIRRAEDGKRVLLTCYNKPLAVDLRLKLEPWKGITVATFHELCLRFANEADISIPEDPDSDRLFNEIYPQALICAFKILKDCEFDAIIVDEGQDFTRLWISALYPGLSSGGVLRIFYDSNQSVYGNITTFPDDIELLPIKLSLNMRNTRQIHTVIQNYYSGTAMRSIGPEGVNVEWIQTESERYIYPIIDEKIRNLISEERVKPSDIAVLVASGREFAECAPNNWLGGVECRKSDENSDEAVILDTVRRFKGLESRIVIVAATHGLVGDREMIYVALSRARVHLIVVGDVTEIKRMAISRNGQSE